jgi:FkbM family methyltransferase
MLISFLKGMVRENHWLFLSWYNSRFGMLPALARYAQLLANKGIGRAPNMLGSDVFLRPGTTDQDVFDEIFVDREYDIDLGDPRFIVDAGAHIGLSSVFFSSKYPKATVVAIEPEPSNFDLLLMNTRNFPNIKPLRAGLWSRRAFLRIEASDVPTWSFRVVEDSSGQGIPALGIPDVMADFNAERIDILKMDIEGSEVEVLNSHRGWMSKVGTLIIELHDRLRPGCSEALAHAVSGHEYDQSRSGESVVISNLRRAVPAGPGG